MKTCIFLQWGVVYIRNVNSQINRRRRYNIQAVPYVSFK